LYEAGALLVGQGKIDQATLEEVCA
jgi:hypothetical protein